MPDGLQEKFTLQKDVHIIIRCILMQIIFLHTTDLFVVRALVSEKFHVMMVANNSKYGTLHILQRLKILINCL